MKSLGEIYWDIDHECLHSGKTISLMDESTMLFHAAEEYVEELLKFGDRWKSIVLHDIDYLKVSSFVRRTQIGYSRGAKIFLSYIYKELERYGLKIDDEGDIPPVIPKSGEDEINRLPPDMIGIFKTFDEYKTFIADCKSLHKPKQIVGRLMDFNISLDYGNTDIIHKHLKKKGIINVSYSHFCRLIREENGA